MASSRERATSAAARLGLVGAAHAVTLVAFGIPILLAERYLPQNVQRGAETAVAALIVFLAVRLLVRWRRLVRPSRRRQPRPPSSREVVARRVRDRPRARHGRCGVGVLLLAAIPSRELAIAALLVLAVFTAVSMTLVTTGYGAVLGARGARGAIAAAGARRQPRFRLVVRGCRPEPRALPVLAARYSRAAERTIRRVASLVSGCS